MTSRSNPAASPVPDLYLPTNAQTLLAALASSVGTDHPAEIVYLDDDSPLPDYVGRGIRHRFPQITLAVRSDRAAIEEFATLPAGFPDLLRRNVALGLRGFYRPADRPPSWLGHRYRTAYVYLTGKFLSKTLRRRCETIVLREEGLGNYHSLPFGCSKALLRLAIGRSPQQQIMGEEGWIDRIEVTQPEALPLALQAKARRLCFPDLLSPLPAGVARELAAIFWDGPPPPLVEGSALVLTQPIDTAGFCRATEKRAIYQTIVQRLAEAGFAVILKRHPREKAELAEEAAGPVIPPFFPIEAWPWLTAQKFDLAVALCTSALDRTGGLFSRHQLQLVDPESFGRKELGNWRTRLELWCAVHGRNPGT